MMLDDNKRPDVTTLLPWARGSQWLGCDSIPKNMQSLTVPPHRPHQVRQTTKHHRRRQTSTSNCTVHNFFYSFAVDTAGVWHDIAYSCHKRFADTSLQSQNTPAEKPLCSNAALWLFKDGMRSSSGTP